MNLAQAAKELNLEFRAGIEEASKEVKGGYVSDLLSDVIANAKDGDLWITLQLHQNIVAVAFLNNLAGIVIVGGRQPEEDTLQKAQDQGIPILTTTVTAYEIVGRMYELGIRPQLG